MTPSPTAQQGSSLSTRNKQITVSSFTPEGTATATAFKATSPNNKVISTTATSQVPHNRVTSFKAISSSSGSSGDSSDSGSETGSSDIISGSGGFGGGSCSTNNHTVTTTATGSSIGPYDHKIHLPLPIPAYELHKVIGHVQVQKQMDHPIDIAGITANNSNSNSNSNRTTPIITNTIMTSSYQQPNNTNQQLQQQQQQQQYHPENNNNYEDSTYEPSQIDSESYLELHEAAAQMQNNPHYHHHQHQRGFNSNIQMVDDSSTILTANYIAASSSNHHHTNYAIENSHTSSFGDATDVVHEMHLALLYLLSNPEEFATALHATENERNVTTLQQWNAEYDNESLITTDTDYNNTTTQQQQQQGANGIQNTNETSKTASPPGQLNGTTSNNPAVNNNGSKIATATPLPFVVFADDAEVVLPQAHTASQLFGIERLEGIELEAAAGIPALCQLFLRWLALMPGGDHLNIIDPPGLTVMRIAGGRYRVTAAHRVVWTWMNEFAQLTMNKNHTATITKSGSSSPTSSPLRGTSCSTVNTTAANRRKNAIHNGGDAVDQLQIGDLVTMTIVDVFETDSNGKLLSYCPTFDNRAVMKTNATGEAFRKSSSKMLAALSRAQKSKLAISVANQASIFAHTIKKKVDKAVYGNGSGSSSTGSRDDNSASNSPHEATRNDNAGGLVVPDDDEYHHTTKNDKTNNNNTISNKLLVAPSTSTFDDNNSDVNIPSLTKSLKNHPDIMTTNKLHHHYLDDDDLERHEI